MFGFLKKKPESIVKTSSEKLEKMLSTKIPIVAVPYVMNHWNANPFNFSITKSRKSCLGNYRLKEGQHFITVNGDSNTYSFLVTLIHEIAHQHVALKTKLFRRKTAPHGEEWKSTFSNLMQPLLIEAVFPEKILTVLKKHMENPAASSTRDPLLVKALGIIDEKESSGGVTLSEIASGKIFVFNNKRYRKLENRRTRTLVECTSSKKKYTIASYAPIQIID